MADAPAAPAAPSKPAGGSLTSFASLMLVIVILFDPFHLGLRTKLGEWVGVVLNPAIGFGGKYPVLTILISGTLLVVLTTVIRHFTTDWLEQAKVSSYMRAFNAELMKARKENNTYKTKKLMDRQPELMLKQQEMSTKQMRTMPLTMVVVVPLFSWLFLFLSGLAYWWYSAPWNARVDMFAATLFPHYILLYMTLSIPLGALVQKAMKYASWKERWQKRHPEVHEG